MGMDAMTRKVHPILLGLILLFSIIDMCISAWITAKYNANHNNPDSGIRARVRFAVFTSVWSIVITTILLVAFLFMPANGLASVGSQFVLLMITWILWLAVAASITQTLGGALDCTTEEKFVYCGQLNALQGFNWLIWVLLTFIVIWVLIRGIQAARRGEGFGGSMVERDTV
ncbi:hypothetical protein BJ165DRAFT_1398385 [Panaeolus papilionaceus]|nr:hypothetical protein BJ165DRAFT_1398385 [Panaeolus papilionaceus]